MIVDARALIRRHEGERSKPYTDTVGKITIGIGRNLTDKGLTSTEIEMLFENDFREAAQRLSEIYPPWIGLDENRRTVLLNMSFNMGYRLRSFAKMWKAIRVKDFKRAATEMLDSQWAKQVGERSAELARLMRMGNGYRPPA